MGEFVMSHHIKEQFTDGGTKHILSNDSKYLVFSRQFVICTILPRVRLTHVHC